MQAPLIAAACGKSILTLSSAHLLGKLLNLPLLLIIMISTVAAWYGLRASFYSANHGYWWYFALYMLALLISWLIIYRYNETKKGENNAIQKKMAAIVRASLLSLFQINCDCFFHCFYYRFSHSLIMPTIAAAGFILLPRSTMRAIIFLVRPALSAPLCCGIFLAGLPLLSPA